MRVACPARAGCAIPRSGRPMVTRLAQAAGEDAGACGSRVGARRLDPGPAAAPGHRHGRAHAATGRCADHSRTAGFKALQTPGRKEAQARCSKLIEHRTACNRASNIYHGARRTALGSRAPPRRRTEDRAAHRPKPRHRKRPRAATHTPVTTPGSETIEIGNRRHPPQPPHENRSDLSSVRGR